MSNCENCEYKKAPPKEVSYAYVELLNNAHKSTVWRLWVAILALVIALAVSNGLWLKAWNEYDYSTTEIKQDGRGLNIIGDYNDTEYDQYEPIDKDTDTNP